MIAADSYVKLTRQSWKIWLFLLLLLVAGVLLFIRFTMAREQPANFVTLVMGGSCLAAIALIWLAISVRCKNCKSRLGWNAISKQSQAGWFFWLLKSEACPICQDNGVIKNGQKMRGTHRR